MGKILKRAIKQAETLALWLFCVLAIKENSRGERKMLTYIEDHLESYWSVEVTAVAIVKAVNWRFSNIFRVIGKGEKNMIYKTLKESKMIGCNEIGNSFGRAAYFCKQKQRILADCIIQRLF